MFYWAWQPKPTAKEYLSVTFISLSVRPEAYFCNMVITIRIREHSFLARLAAWKLNSRSVAIVFGTTIHLWNVDKDSFLQNQRWFLHEMEHIRQYKELGFFRFIYQYLLESIRKGYHNNRFEVEAREAEEKTFSPDFLIL